jgi:hypothetical protein
MSYSIQSSLPSSGALLGYHFHVPRTTRGNFRSVFRVSSVGIPTAVPGPSLLAGEQGRGGAATLGPAGFLPRAAYVPLREAGQAAFVGTNLVLGTIALQGAEGTIPLRFRAWRQWADGEPCRVMGVQLHRCYS